MAVLVLGKVDCGELVLVLVLVLVLGKVVAAMMAMAVQDGGSIVLRCLLL